MNTQDVNARTEQFAPAVIQLVERLPNEQTSRVLGKQSFRSGASAAANYRAASRGRSTSDYISKIGIVEEEADESDRRMALIIESGKLQGRETLWLL